MQQSQSVVDAYEKSLVKNPNQKVICGFSRRFDASYRDAYQRVARGDVGTPSVFRSQTCDKLDPSGFFVDYAEFSGGIFVDCSIHDIDLALWFFGEDSVVKSVSAIGITAVQEGPRKHNDRDNAVAVVEFYVSSLPYTVFYTCRSPANTMRKTGRQDRAALLLPHDGRRPGGHD